MEVEEGKVQVWRSSDRQQRQLISGQRLLVRQSGALQVLPLREVLQDWGISYEYIDLDSDARVIDSGSLGRFAIKRGDYPGYVRYAPDAQKS